MRALALLGCASLTVACVDAGVAPPTAGATGALASCGDVRSDGANCGLCGNVCSPAEACVDGLCVGGAEMDPSGAAPSPIASPLPGVDAGGLPLVDAHEPFPGLDSGSTDVGSADAGAADSGPRDAGVTPGIWYERGPDLSGRLDGVYARLATDAGAGEVDMLVASPGGGIWARRAGATRWAAVRGYGLADHSVVHLEQDVLRPERIWAVTWNGLAVTDDFGDRWRIVANEGLIPGGLLPQTLVIDPKPFAQLRYDGTPGRSLVLWSEPCRGIWYSFDGGEHFDITYPFSGAGGAEANCIGNIVADPISHRVYFTTNGLNPGGREVFRSAGPWEPDAPALAWEPVQQGFLAPNVLIQSLASASVPGLGYDRLVALTNESVPMLGTGTATYVTTDVPDAGLIWQRRSVLLGEARDGGGRAPLVQPRPLVFARTGSVDELFQGNLVFYASRSDTSAPDGGPLLGEMWEPFNLPGFAQHADVRAVFVDRGLGRLWFATDGFDPPANNVLVQWDWHPGGVPPLDSPEPVDPTGLRSWQTYFVQIIPLPDGSRRVFIGAQDNGSRCTDEIRGLPATAPMWTPGNIGCGDCIAMRVSPRNPNVGYSLGGTGIPLFKRGDGLRDPEPCGGPAHWSGRQFPPEISASPTPRYWSSNTLAIDPANPDVVWLVYGRGVATSSEGGVNLSTFTLPDGAVPVSITVGRDGSAYVGTEDQGVFQRRPGRRDFVRIASGAEVPGIVLALAITLSGEPALYAGTTQGIYRWSGFPIRWRRVRPGAGYSVSDLAVDPACPTRIYAALGFVPGRQYHRGGVLVTLDAGDHWDSLTSGLAIHQGPVSDVEVDPVDSRYVYAASYGHGVWYQDWGSRLPACRRRP